MTLFFMALFLVNGGWEIAETGIFSELNKNRVVVTADDHVFLSEFTGSSIAHYRVHAHFSTPRSLLPAEGCAG